MIRLSRLSGARRPSHLPASVNRTASSSPQPIAGRALFCAVACLLSAAALGAQVFTVDTSGKGTTKANGPVDRRYAQVAPTHVELSKAPLDAKTRIELIRALQSEQGFAMRPFPRGHKGLTLAANGKLSPAGEAYLNAVTSSGTSAKPGDRVVFTDVQIEHGKIVFLINGGPDFKHRLLRHIQVGGGNVTAPVIQDTEPDPQGARLTLDFGGRIPEVTPKQVKALLAPLISFDVKTPIQAFTDTLPAVLRDAILSHEVWVGMSIDMVLFAKGQPRTKTREMDGQMPFEEWIYGLPPAEVEFVRINGNRVIRVEVAKVGEKPVIFTENRVEGLLMTDGSPAAPEVAKVRVQQVGDVQKDPDRQAPDAPPSLRKPGEQTADDRLKGNQPPGQKNTGVMRPVQFPPEHPDPPTDAGKVRKQPGANPDEEPAPPAAAPSPQPPVAGSTPQN